MLKLIQFLVDFNNNTCSASFGVAFKADGPLMHLPKEKDGKRVHVVGLTPYTLEYTIDVPWESRTVADNICTSWYNDAPNMILRLEALKVN